MIKKLRIKFILVSMLSLICILACVIASINIISYNRMVSRADATLDFLMENGGSFPMFDGRFPGGIANSEYAPENISYGSRFFTVLVLDTGAVLPIITNDSNLEAEAAGQLAIYVLTSSEGERGFFGNYRYLINTSSDHTMLIFLDCSSSISSNKSFVNISIAISCVGIAAVAVLIYFLSAFIVRPAVESSKKQKRFITDAGHELKTPLTIIDADAELIEMESGQSEWLDDIRTQTKRLASLTNDLIYLSRMEEDEYVLQRIEFPISDMITERAGSFVSRFKTENKILNLRVEKMLTYKGDEKAISQLVSLLLDNALKYSSDKGIVEIGLRKQSRAIVLYVANTVDHITKEEADRFFDRFWRSDKSRSGGGHGLGLSCAKAIVTAHKGRITASPINEKMVQISVILPI